MLLYYIDMRDYYKYIKLSRKEISRNDSVFGRKLLAYAVLKNYFIHMPYISRAYGKPFFPERPDIHFSISHSNGHILCGISNYNIGVDIEASSRYVPPSIIERITTPSEREDFSFLTLWVLRESFFKLTGSGSLRSLHFGIENNVIVSPDPSVRCKVYNFPDFTAAACTFNDTFPSDITVIKPNDLNNSKKP